MAGGHSLQWWLGALGWLAVLAIGVALVGERLKQLLEAAFGAQMQDASGGRSSRGTSRRGTDGETPPGGAGR